MSDDVWSQGLATAVEGLVGEGSAVVDVPLEEATVKEERMARVLRWITMDLLVPAGSRPRSALDSRESMLGAGLRVRVYGGT
jgi:hypothetical protein